MQDTTTTAPTRTANSANNIAEAKQNLSGWEAEGRWTSAPIRLSTHTKRFLSRRSHLKPCTTWPASCRRSLLEWSLDVT